MSINEKRMNEFVYQMQTVGFSVFEGFLSEANADFLRSLVEQELVDYKEYGTERSHLDRHHLHDLICKYIDVAKLLEDERLDSLLAQILGRFWIMYAFTGSSCPPKSTNYGGRVHTDSPRWIDGYPTNVGVLWALDDFTIENGGTKVLPASHHSEQIPTKEYFDANSIQVECKKGSLIIFNARVVHSTGFNHTSEWRHALTMNACRSYMKQRMDWVRFIPNEISAQLNETARRIIGFDTRLPTNLMEFFLPEEQRLYKPNQG
jgi:ectoine hydroxylase-related dioxygenase (phytanoyl-CoA dioxygenase family)